MDVALGRSGPRRTTAGPLRLKDGDREMSLTETIRRIGIVAAAASLFGVAGCNTVEGVGEDIEAAGDAIEDGADDRRQ